MRTGSANGAPCRQDGNLVLRFIDDEEKVSAGLGQEAAMDKMAASPVVNRKSIGAMLKLNAGDLNLFVEKFDLVSVLPPPRSALG